MQFQSLEILNDGDHSFSAYECMPTGDLDLVAELAAIVRELYVNTERLRDILVAAVNETEAIIDTDRIKEAIERTLAASVPIPGSHPVPQLDVARNELAEALANLALSTIHGTVIPAPRIANKEVPGTPARGLDLLGFEDLPLLVVVSETKASSAAASPPPVVGTGPDSLRSQLKRFLGTDDRLLSEFSFALKHSKSEHHLLIARAILAHIDGTLSIVIAPILVRPKNGRGASDYGTFQTNPTEFTPARVRFCLLVIDRPLDELANAVYEGARA